jgi:hexosaminidase
MPTRLNLLPLPRRIEIGDGYVPPDTLVAEAIDRRVARPQGYEIRIAPGRVDLIGHDPDGLFYAHQTLVQLRREWRHELPVCRIEDWPDFPARGVMLDVSRDKVPTTATLFGLVEQLAELKVNQLQLYTEHTFAYPRHREVWKDASPLTPDDVRYLDIYCRAHHIELVPNQNSFGHMERWLKHPRYVELAEKPDGFTFPWGTRHEGGFTLNPLDPRSLELIEGLYDELLPHFTSRQINVGCDETFDLGLGKSKQECDRRGKARVYLDFLLKIYDAVTRRGRRMQFWGDIVLEHPELIGELPRDVIALNWGYEAGHPFARETKAFADAGVPFYVCPGTSSIQSIAGRTDNALANLRESAENGLRNGAIGYLNTDWGDMGHLQYLPISYLGLAVGAANAWCLDANRDLDIPAALDLHVFRDAAGVMGRLVYDLGNVYHLVKAPQSMSTRLFWAFVGGAEWRSRYEVISKAEYDASEAAIDVAVARLDEARMDRPDARLIRDEIRNAVTMLRHGCRRGRRMQGTESMTTSQLADDLRAIIAEHRRLWLARNRPGGLNDSARRLEARLAEYESNA